MTKEEMIDAIYNAIGPSHIGYEAYTDEYNLVIMLGDVFSRIEEKLDDDFGYIIELYNLREHKREPIEKQSKECVLFIYELICTTTTNEKK